MGTKRSLKNTLISTLSGLSRNLRGSFWDHTATPDSTKDKPIDLSLMKDLMDDVSFRMMSLHLTTPSTDFVAFDSSDAISIAGSVYTVDREFYAVQNGVLYKVNTGNDTLLDTIRLVAGTDSAMYLTLDIEDGTSGSGIIDYGDILWAKDVFSVDIENEKVRAKAIVDEDDTGPVDLEKGLTISGAGKLSLGTSTELTIASGVVTITRSYHSIDTQANASTDDLDTINGGEEGDILFLFPASDVRDVVIKHETGNIHNPLNTDLTLNSNKDMVMLIYRGGTWILTANSEAA